MLHVHVWPSYLILKLGLRSFHILYPKNLCLCKVWARHNYRHSEYALKLLFFGVTWYDLDLWLRNVIQVHCILFDKTHSLSEILAKLSKWVRGYASNKWSRTDRVQTERRTNGSLYINRQQSGSLKSFLHILALDKNWRHI